MHCLAEIWQGYSVQQMTTSVSLHGSLTSQDDKFELSSTLPSCHKKSRLTTSGLFCCLSIKTFISGQNERTFRKWYYCKSCSSVEHIWNKLVKAQHLSLSTVSFSRLAIMHCESHSKSYQDNVWCQTLITADPLTYQKLLVHRTPSWV